MMYARTGGMHALGHVPDRCSAHISRLHLQPTVPKLHAPTPLLLHQVLLLRVGMRGRRAGLLAG